MKKLLLILEIMFVVNTVNAVELGLTAGTLGAGVEVGYKYHDFEIDGIYNHATINYQNVDTNFRGYELLFKYYINNNFYLVGGYINETIDARVDATFGSRVPIEFLDINATADYNNINKNVINSPYVGLGYKTYMTTNLILDINTGVAQSYKENNQNILIKTDASDMQLNIPVHEGNYTVYPIFNLSIKYKF